MAGALRIESIVGRLPGYAYGMRLPTLLFTLAQDESAPVETTALEGLVAGSLESLDFTPPDGAAPARAAVSALPSPCSARRWSTRASGT
jgi:hypothetical protein